MDVLQLIDDSLEQDLQIWLKKWSSAIDALNNIGSLFDGMEQSNILGDVSEHVSITGPVHIGKGSKIHPFVTIEGPVGNLGRMSACVYHNKKPSLHWF